LLLFTVTLTWSLLKRVGFGDRRPDHGSCGDCPRGIGGPDVRNSRRTMLWGRGPIRLSTLCESRIRTGSAAALDEALGVHRLGYADEPCRIRADDQVARLAVLLCLLVAVSVDAAHDLVQALLGVRKRPAVAGGVLLHLQCGGRDSAGVRRLAGAMQPFRTRAVAASLSSSFSVAEGTATVQGTSHTEPPET